MFGARLPRYRTRTGMFDDMVAAQVRRLGQSVAGTDTSAPVRGGGCAAFGSDALADRAEYDDVPVLPRQPTAFRTSRALPHAVADQGHLPSSNCNCGPSGDELDLARLSGIVWAQARKSTPTGAWITLRAVSLVIR